VSLYNRRCTWLTSSVVVESKYIKVKRYYFEKDAQVQELQNTVAHQRMSAVRTVFDDNEYTTRFNRLDGAINNLAFNIRKDWKHVPTFLQGMVSEDAHLVGTKEMTAAGRAFITRLLVDEIFDRYFHPGLEPNLSLSLKSIEHGIRRMRATTTDEQDSHWDRLSFWRRTTLDGLHDVLRGKVAEDNRGQFIGMLVEKLTASLEMNMRSPPPAGLENGVAMIVELAVGIASNIPLESRDVRVEYPLPGSPIVESHMKLETTLLGLTPSMSDLQHNPSEPSSAATDQIDQGSMKGVDPPSISEPRGEYNGSDAGSTAPPNGAPQTIKEARKKSVFGALIGKKPPLGSTPGQGQQLQPQPQQAQLPTSQPQDPPRPNSASVRERSDERSRDQDLHRIRFAAFVSVEVRNRGGVIVLVKAPVYPIL
jgi:hypothetical protein